jgi:protein-disulfide isomerase
VATADDMALGSAAAPVTVIEYASLSCPHCGRWNRDVFPTFKAKYIDTGRVHYVFREYLTEPVQMAAAGFLLARCAGKDKYFGVLDQVFRAQDQIFVNGQIGDIRGPLVAVAAQAGMTEAQFNSCVGDDKALAALNARVDKAGKEAGITGTPTFFVNGTKLDGEQTIQQLDAAIAAAQAKK